MGKRMVCLLVVQQQTLPKTLKKFYYGILGGGGHCTGEMLHTIPLDGAVVPLEHPYVLSCRSICWPKTAMNSYVFLAAEGQEVRDFFFLFLEKEDYMGLIYI